MAGSRKLGRTSDQRKAMLRAMVTFLYFLIIFEYIYLFLSSSDDKITAE